MNFDFKYKQQWLKEGSDKFGWVSDLESPLFSWNLDKILNTLKNQQNSEISIMNYNGECQSFILWLDLAFEAEILALATHPLYQEQNKMSILLKTWLSWLKGQNYKTVYLEVHAQNEPALKLYQKFSFQYLKKRPEILFRW